MVELFPVTSKIPKLLLVPPISATKIIFCLLLSMLLTCSNFLNSSIFLSLGKRFRCFLQSKINRIILTSYCISVSLYKELIRIIFLQKGIDMNKHKALAFLLLTVLNSAVFTTFSNEDPSEKVTRGRMTGGKIYYLHTIGGQGNRAQAVFNDVLKNNSAVIVDFYADWCGPCQALGRTLSDIASQFSNVVILKVDIDKSSIHNQYGVRGIPAVLFFKNGREVKNYRIVGMQNKNQIVSKIKSCF
jgi:thioredoxin 1